jgi:hypothetical protein
MDGAPFLEIAENRGAVLHSEFNFLFPLFLKLV